jgi:hypothetical protein
MDATDAVPEELGVAVRRFAVESAGKEAVESQNCSLAPTWHDSSLLIDSSASDQRREGAGASAKREDLWRPGAPKEG